MTPSRPPAKGFRTFLILWATQSLSVFGSAITFFAVTVWLTQVLYPHPGQKAELALALSAVSLAYALPTVLVAPLAGVCADRYNKKTIMLAMDLANSGLCLTLASLLVAQSLQLWLLIVLTVLTAVITTFHSAAFDTAYVLLVPEKWLPRANGMMQTMWSLSGILSPALAAGIITLPALARQGWVPAPLGSVLSPLADGTSLAILADAVTFGIAAGVLMCLHMPSPCRAAPEAGVGGPRPGIWSDMETGASYIWQRRPLLWLLGTFTIANFAAAPIQVFQPLLLRFNLGADLAAKGFTLETGLAMLGSVGGLGGVAGGLLISIWGGLKARRVYGIMVPMLVSGLVQIVFGLSSLIYLTAAAALMLNAMLPLMNAHSQTIWQTQTPPELQGRVFAVRRVIAQCTWPLSAAMAGWAGSLFDPGLVLAGLGTFLAVVCALQFFNPALLRIEAAQTKRTA